MSAIPTPPAPAIENPGAGGPDPEVVRRAAGLPDLALELVARTGSTQSDLAARARVRAPQAPILRSALHQDTGRGRMGRAWIDEPGGSLLFSLCLPWPHPAAGTVGVTLACGWALAEAIAPALAGRDGLLKVKWPNDLLLGGAKLAGILVEYVNDPAGRATLVVGVGCNLALGPQARERIGRSATDLASVLGPDAALLLRDRLLGQSAAALLSACEEFGRLGFGHFRERFLARLAFRGERVRLLEEGCEPRAGSLLGVDEHGRLMLGTANGIETAGGGELRREGAG
jgi:BirA family biotin operon repressor/biotin-[acetyl-CoA-carboxylase] ligase